MCLIENVKLQKDGKNYPKKDKILWSLKIIYCIVFLDTFITNNIFLHYLRCFTYLRRFLIFIKLVLVKEKKTKN